MTSLRALAFSALAAGCTTSLPFVELSELHVTEGSITTASGSLHIEAPGVRAVLREPTEPDAELWFQYLGPTSERAPLASGDERVQIGLKLRAADSCNVVYAMLRIEPTPSVVVQVKQNPSMHTHDECGNAGYRTVRPDESAPVQRVEVGSAHRLRATLSGEKLAVLFDGQRVWRGDIGALGFDGPVGLRSDNGRFDIELVRRRAR